MPLHARAHIFSTTRRLLTAAFLFGILASSAFAQQEAQMKVSAKQRAAIVDSIAMAIESTYVFPDKGKAMAQLIRQNLKKKAYDTVSTLGGLAMKLTDDLRSITHDRHIGIQPIASDAPSMRPSDTLTSDMKERMREGLKGSNYGFRGVQILDGNIGYVDMSNFIDTQFAAPTAVAAMNFLANTNAVIFDMRKNGGGDPSMCQLIMSYFLEKPTLINTFYDRPGDSTEERWTMAEVKGPRMTTLPVYILTSHRTFSCAEEFSYDFQSLKRGTIIGETTGGGAHPVTTWAFPEIHVAINVPFGRAINPYTKTNWEGAGVKPDIDTTAEQSLGVAHVKALEELLAKATDSTSQRDVAWMLDGVRSRYQPIQLDESQMMEFVGAYGPRTISVANGTLQSQRGTNPPIALHPMGRDVFSTDFPDLRMRFVRDGFGKVSTVQLLNPEGVYDSSPKQSN